LLQSRMQVGLARYAQQYPNIDQLIFEPNAGDAELFFTNAFSFSARRRICEIAYRNTMADLRRRADELAPVLDANGLALRMHVVNDENRTLLDGLAPPPRDSDTTARLRRALDDMEHRQRPAAPAPRRRPRAPRHAP